MLKCIVSEKWGNKTSSVLLIRQESPKDTKQHENMKTLVDKTIEIYQRIIRTQQILPDTKYNQTM